MSFLPASVRGVIVGLLFLINILIMGLLIILTGFVRYITPIKSWRKGLETFQTDMIPSAWIEGNRLLLQLAGKTEWVVEGEGQLNYNHWYFIFANHRTWADIVVMQQVFNRKIRLLKFFLKKELLWTLPMGGLACYMLGFPFMKRHSKAYLRKHPEKKNADLEATKLACDRFKLRPTSVMNFLEGTRFTPEKQRDRSSPYTHLLRPKAGGLAFVVSELRDYMKEVIDVTIIYSHKEPTFWNLLTGSIPKIIVKYKVIPLDEALYGEYYQDPAFRKQFQGWVNSLWHKKDLLIGEVMAKESAQ